MECARKSPMAKNVKVSQKINCRTRTTIENFALIEFDGDFKRLNSEDRKAINWPIQKYLFASVETFFLLEFSVAK